MNHADRLRGLEATAADMDRLGFKQRARAIRRVLVPYYNWLEAEMKSGEKAGPTADTIARVLANAVEFFAAGVGGTQDRQRTVLLELMSRIADEVDVQHKGRFGRH